MSSEKLVNFEDLQAQTEELVSAINSKDAAAIQAMRNYADAQDTINLQSAMDYADAQAGSAAASSIPLAQKGTPGGVAELNSQGIVPSHQLPSFVDDVIEGYRLGEHFYSDAAHTTIVTDETGQSADQLSGKIYVDLGDNKTYRWAGSDYAVISESLALGTTEATAGRGDWTYTGYQHALAKGSQFASNLYKITTNAEGHVIAATAVTKADLTALGVADASTLAAVAISGSYGDLSNTPANATESTRGFMSSDDKQKLEGSVSLLFNNAGYLPTPVSMIGSDMGVYYVYCEDHASLDVLSQVIKACFEANNRTTITLPFDSFYVGDQYIEPTSSGTLVISGPATGDSGSMSALWTNDKFQANLTFDYDYDPWEVQSSPTIITYPELVISNMDSATFALFTEGTTVKVQVPVSLLSMIAALKSQISSIKEAVYPVGSIYMSVNPASPATLFGGTWERITGSFLLAATDGGSSGASQAAGNTGGAASVTLTAAQSGIRAHSHNLNSHTHTYAKPNSPTGGTAITTAQLASHTHAMQNHTHSGTTSTNGSHSHTVDDVHLSDGSGYAGPVWGGKNSSTSNNVWPTSSNGDHTHTMTTGGPSNNTTTSTGSGSSHTHTVGTTSTASGAASGNTANNTASSASEAHENMPPYLSVYVWKRTA